MDAKENQMQLHAIVEGRVQGVGFRYFVQEAAVALELTGWVRNRWEGTVEVLAEGDKASLDDLVRALRRGPRSGNVTHLQEDWQPASGEFTSFSVRMTV